MCWVAYNHLQSATVFEKYSWSALKALSEMVTAGIFLNDCNDQLTCLRQTSSSNNECLCSVPNGQLSK